MTSYAELSQSAIVQLKAFKFAMSMVHNPSLPQSDLEMWQENAANAYFSLQRYYEKMDKWVLKKMSDANLQPVHHEPATQKLPIIRQIRFNGYARY